MAGFKDFLANDLNTFFNLEEFSEIHNIDGNDITIVPDDDLLKERQIKSAGGTYVGDLLFYVRKSDWGPRPAIGSQVVKFDQERYRVTDYQENSGVCTITLEAYGS
jgi:hypothetical protein